MYLLYVVIVYFNTSLEGCFERLTGINKEETDIIIERSDRSSDEEQSVSRGDAGDGEEKLSPTGHPGDGEEMLSPTGAAEEIKRVVWILVLPVTCLFYVTIPDCRRKK